MTQTQLISTVANATGYPKTQVQRIIESLSEIVMAEVRQGEKVNTPIGCFKRQDRKARKGINPATGEAIQVPAKRVPKFLPNTTFKETVKGR